mgnify:CR=1 FL=1
MKKLNIDWNTDVYCLIGNPISKSLSPKIHNYIFSLNNKNSVYLAFKVEENLKTVIHSFRALNIKGFNVTIPYKVEIMKYLDEIEEDAKVLGAVNTVKNVNGKLVGYNTDGTGFIESLKKEGIKIENKNFIILGSGGASQAISKKLAMEGAKKIVILNRTVEKATTLGKSIKNMFNQVDVYCDSLDNVYKYLETDVVINCTSIGMYPKESLSPVDSTIFNKNTVICDIIYKPIETKFLRDAKQNNAKTIGGLSMLINQAILSQQIWSNSNNEILKYFEKIKGFLCNDVE